MKLILLPLLLLLSLLVQSQPVTVDTSYLNGNVTDTSNTGIKIIGDTVFYHYGKSTQVYYLTERKMTIDSVYRIDGEHLYIKKSLDPKLYKLPEVPKDTVPEYHLNYRVSSWSTESHKGHVETPINVMDSGMKVEVVETRDTIYKCPQTYGFTLLAYDSNSVSFKAKDSDCTIDKIVTTRRYKLYIINEYGQKEYLSMELTKQK